MHTAFLGLEPLAWSANNRQSAETDDCEKSNQPPAVFAPQCLPQQRNSFVFGFGRWLRFCPFVGAVARTPATPGSMATEMDQGALVAEIEVNRHIKASFSLALMMPCELIAT